MRIRMKSNSFLMIIIIHAEQVLRLFHRKILRMRHCQSFLSVKARYSINPFFSLLSQTKLVYIHRHLRQFFSSYKLKKRTVKAETAFRSRVLHCSSVTCTRTVFIKPCSRCRALHFPLFFYKLFIDCLPEKSSSLQ